MGHLDDDILQFIFHSIDVPDKRDAVEERLVAAVAESKKQEKPAVDDTATATATITAPSEPTMTSDDPVNNSEPQLEQNDAGKKFITLFGRLLGSLCRSVVGQSLSVDWSVRFVVIPL